MSAVKMIRALKRRLDEERESKSKEKEDPKKAKKGKAGVALVASSSRILLTIRGGKLVLPFPIGMMGDKKTKGQYMLIKFTMEMQVQWLASLLKSWRQKQFRNLKNRKRKQKQKNAGVGL